MSTETLNRNSNKPVLLIRSIILWLLKVFMCILLQIVIGPLSPVDFGTQNQEHLFAFNVIIKLLIDDSSRILISGLVYIFVQCYFGPTLWLTLLLQNTKMRPKITFFKDYSNITGNTCITMANKYWYGLMHQWNL